jgi:predicted amidophosphoribosyltransferase
MRRCTTILLTNETVICTSCRHDIPLTNHHLMIENEAYKNLWRIPAEHASAFLYFHKKGIVQELIHNLKIQRT